MLFLLFLISKNEVNICIYSLCIKLSSSVFLFYHLMKFLEKTSNCTVCSSSFSVINTNTNLFFTRQSVICFIKFLYKFLFFAHFYFHEKALSLKERMCTLKFMHVIHFYSHYSYK